MDDTLENKICPHCQAEIRLNALFCYNCGSQVASDEEVAADQNPAESMSNVWFKESITQEDSDPPKAAEVKPKPAVGVEKATVKSSAKVKSEKGDLSKLKTAASLRQKQKFSPSKPVEVVWDDHRNAPNFWFLIVSIILAVFAFVMIAMMLYVR